MPLPGDDLIDRPAFDATHGVDLPVPPEQVWPWIVQMGSGRGGWYSYDFIDNGGVPSARRILPEHQRLAVGDVVPALPGRTDMFLVHRVTPARDLALVVPDGDQTQATWTVALRSSENGCRLLVRCRVGYLAVPIGRRRLAVPRWLLRLFMTVGHAVMQRKQLEGLRQRVTG